MTSSSTSSAELLTSMKASSRYRTNPPKGFQCYETVDKDGDVGDVSFHCTLPTTGAGVSNDDNDNSHQEQQQQQRKELVFSCRGRSVGVLLNNETAANDEDFDTGVNVDPNFFDSGYTLAGATGFQVWAASRLLIESLTWPPLASSSKSSLNGHDDRGDYNNTSLEPSLMKWQKRIIRSNGEYNMSDEVNTNTTARPLRILELGSGIGVVGSCLAHAGAQVLLTDLPTLVEYAIQPNLLQNCDSTATNNDSDTTTDPPPTWLDPDDDESMVVKIGQGWAGTAVIDWTIPVNQQLTLEQQQSVDVIVASDCVWLVSMLNALLDTVESIFAEAWSGRKSPAPSFIMSFQRRDANDKNSATGTSDEDDGEKGTSTGSTMFTTVEGVLEAVQARNWNIQCLAWRYVSVEKEDNPLDKESKEVFVFEITPKP